MITNEEIIKELAKFLRNETLEECPIKITSREAIEGEEAELIRFTFGVEEDSCVAIAYSDGCVYTPRDWQNPVWNEDGWKITDSAWMDCFFRECDILNGMPRMFFL